MSIIISVIIPTYNRAAFICKTVESVLKQTFTGFELIVVDDGSTDNTEELLEKFSKFPNFRYFFQPNKGRSIARNMGSSLAKGEWIMYLDSDDYLVEDALDKLYRLALEAKESDMVFANFLYVSNNREHTKQGHLFTGKSLNRNLFADLVAQRYCFTKTGAYLVKKKLDQEVGGFVTAFEPGEDYDYALKLLSRAKLSYSADIVLYVERHTDNTTDKAIETAFIKIWKHYLSVPRIWEGFLSVQQAKAVRDNFTQRIANSSYEMNEHGEAFTYYRKLVVSKPSVFFTPFIFKQFFASMLPVKLKMLIKRT